jgi:hypothetical protein
MEPVFDENEFYRSPIHSFGEGDGANREFLGILPNEIWLHIFSYFSAKELAAIMLVCKFFVNITDDASIRSQLWAAKDSAQRRHQFFTIPAIDLSPIRTSIELSNLLPARDFINNVNNVNYEAVIREAPELYQPGEQGFILKRVS